jgi:hypothetical protein
MEFAELDFEGEGRELYQRLSDRVMERIARIQPPNGYQSLSRRVGARALCREWFGRLLVPFI